LRRRGGVNAPRHASTDQEELVSRDPCLRAEPAAIAELLEILSPKLLECCLHQLSSDSSGACISRNPQR
jgi:hypothetical protein